jgi:hypothetical protein
MLLQGEPNSSGGGGYADMVIETGGSSVGMAIDWPTSVASINVEGASTPLVFRSGVSYSGNRVTTGNEWMRISYGGNIGINNNNPQEKLDVIGNVRFSGALMPNNLAGTAGQVLTSAGAGVAPTWTNMPAGITGTGTATQIAYWSGASSLTSSSNLYWDNTNTRLGIGTASPSYPLDVRGATAYGQIKGTADAGLILDAGAGTDASVFYYRSAAFLAKTYIPSTDNSFRIAVNGVDRMTILPTGVVGIGTVPTGTYKLEVSGKLGTSGINETSDIRYKKKISTIENALGKVMQLRGVNYEWRADEFKEKNFDTTAQIGLIAQEVEKIIPQVVTTDANGYKAVEYSKLVALLIEALKEQEKKIESLQSENQSLKTTNEKEMQSLKADMKTLHDALDILLKENISLKEEKK